MELLWLCNQRRKPFRRRSRTVRKF